MFTVRLNEALWGVCCGSDKNKAPYLAVRAGKDKFSADNEVKEAERSVEQLS